MISEQENEWTITITVTITITITITITGERVDNHRGVGPGLRESLSRPAHHNHLLLWGHGDL